VRIIAVTKKGNVGITQKGNQTKGTGPVSERTEEVLRQMRSLSGRDLQLWSISLLVILVLGAGFAAVVAPNLAWRPEVFRTDARYLPQLFFGLISLVLLFNIYITRQKRELNATRTALVQELIFNERVEGLSLIDPLTQLFNHRAVDQILAKEVVRANRAGTTVSLLMIDVNDFKSINSRFGPQTGDKVLAEAAQLLRNTFRGSDLVFRYGSDEFLAVMPDTTEQQARRAIHRLLLEVERWNVESRMEFGLAISWGLASYALGGNISHTLQTASRQMFLNKHQAPPSP
jgi:diguanylate cyclase (GGDEF)-like protein